MFHSRVVKTGAGSTSAVRMNRYSSHWSAVLTISGTVTYDLEISNAPFGDSDTDAPWVKVLTGQTGAAFYAGVAPVGRVRVTVTAGSGTVTGDIVQGDV